MRKYYRRLVIILTVCITFAGFVVYINNGKTSEVSARMPSEVVFDEIDWKSGGAAAKDARKALVLYSPDDEISVKYRDNIKMVLRHMKMRCEELELSRTESVSYDNYDMVILASDRLETEMTDSVTRLTAYVKEGGRLFWGILQEETGTQYESVFRSLGITEYGGYSAYSKLSIKEEILPGMKDMEFEGEGFRDIGISVNLEAKAKVYVAAKTENGELPMIWNYELGQGSVTVYNGTGISGDFWRGMIAGCISSAFPENMYPIVNASCIFLDDFPSPQYENESTIVKKDYNRNVKEFYRDIWWPDMQKAAKKYGFIYTGLFIATYNDIVDPDDFEFETNTLEQYYGNSLLKNGFEMGAHGYNHQSLAGEGETPEALGYHAWSGQSDMEASVNELEKIASDMFPGVVMTTYVPPSNYLSVEGRKAVKEALPNLKTISGVYTSEGEEGSVYVQDFEIAEDGVAEFPRISSGMMPEDFDTFEYMNGLGLHGVFSHFVHPDDIFDEERGKNQSWEKLYESYCDMLNTVNSRYPFLRELKASDAGTALKAAEAAVPHIIYGSDEITGNCDNFPGEVFFYLRTDKEPVAADGSCEIQKADKKHGSMYYVVTVKKEEFRIELVES